MCSDLGKVVCALLSVICLVLRPGDRHNAEAGERNAGHVHRFGFQAEVYEQICNGSSTMCLSCMEPEWKLCRPAASPMQVFLGPPHVIPLAHHLHTTTV